MAITTISSKVFDRSSRGARVAAQGGPVFITDHGRRAYVLMTIEDYERLAGPQISLSEGLAQSADFDFQPPSLVALRAQPADLD